MTYNALDNQTTAKALIIQLRLEYRDLESTISYGAHLASCDGDEDWSEETENAWQHQQRVSALILALTKYVDPDSGPALLFPQPEAAQS